MKVAMHLAGRFKSTTVRPPTQLPTGEHLERIKKAVQNAGLLQREAAE
jgi:dihydrodipicolinate synthase/N-acetylneuraminate lyase